MSGARALIRVSGCRKPVKSARPSSCCHLVSDFLCQRFRRLRQSPESAGPRKGANSSPTTLSGQGIFHGTVRDRRSTLQQHAQAKSRIYGNVSWEIPGLTRWSRINGKRNPLFCLIPGPVINGNTTVPYGSPSTHRSRCARHPVQTRYPCRQCRRTAPWSWRGWFRAEPWSPVRSATQPHCRDRRPRCAAAGN